MLKLILITLVILSVVIAVRNSVPAGKTKLLKKVPTLPALPTMHPNILQDGIGLFLSVIIIRMLMLFGAGGLVYILN
jgi:hypothetical protein